MKTSMKTSMLTSAIVLAILPIAMMGCATDTAQNESVAGAADEIVSGTVTTARPGVGRIIAWEDFNSDTSRAAACTGTLIGKHTVLTAAHCATSHSTWTRKFYMWMPDGTRKRFGVSKMHIAPGYVEMDISDKFLANSDVAVFTLDADADVAPTPISAGAPRVSEFAVLTGYGLTSRVIPDDSKKRETRNMLSSVLPKYFTFSPVGAFSPRAPGLGFVCDGDSGGPALVVRGYVDGAGNHVSGEVIAGVASFSDCKTLSAHARSDILIKWIQEVSGGDVAIAK